MKSTGVIRRIDELGRIVLPKEIRRNLGIRNGENLEIFVNDDEIILKKFSRFKDFEDIMDEICKLVVDVYGLKLMVTDRDKIVFSNLSDVSVGCKISSNLINLIQNRESVNKREIMSISFNDVEKKGYYFILPIITSTDCLGLLIIYNDEAINEAYFDLLKFISSLIVSKIDIA